MTTRGIQGFSVVELLVATTMLAMAMAAVLAIAEPVQGIFRTQPEVADTQQRLRVGVDVITAALADAGRGVGTGAIGGPLARLLPPVMPYRSGDVRSDAPAGVFYRTDTVSILAVGAGAGQSVVQRVVTPGAQVLEVEASPNCADALKALLCGFTPGLRVLLYDVDGRHDVVTVASVTGRTLVLERHGGSLASRYDSGHAQMAVVDEHTYFLKANPAAATYQLMHYDGQVSDFPVVDNIVGLGFAYLGTPAPPVVTGRLSTIDPGRVETTYGPPPPALGIDDADDAWAAGENCVVAVVNGQQVSRLPPLGPGSSLVVLTPAQLTDGPWCPDAAAAERFDADLLRIRRVRVQMRAQAGSASFRGAAGAFFTFPGTATRSDRVVFDQAVETDITPPNLQVTR